METYNNKNKINAPTVGYNEAYNNNLITKQMLPQSATMK